MLVGLGRIVGAGVSDGWGVGLMIIGTVGVRLGISVGRITPVGVKVGVSNTGKVIVGEARYSGVPLGVDVTVGLEVSVSGETVSVGGAH